MWIYLAVGIWTNHCLLMLHARRCVPRLQFTASVSQQSACSHQRYSHWQPVHMWSATGVLWRFKSDMFVVQNGYAFLFNVVPCLVLYCHVLLRHRMLWALTIVYWEQCCLIGSSQWISYTTLTCCYFQLKITQMHIPVGVSVKRKNHKQSFLVKPTAYTAVGSTELPVIYRAFHSVLGDYKHL